VHRVRQPQTGQQQRRTGNLQQIGDLETSHAGRLMSARRIKGCPRLTRR
jgi:hypothetical protein